MPIQEQELDTRRLEKDEKRIRKRRIGWISDAECEMETTKQCITSFVHAQSWPHLIPRSKTQPDCKDFISRNNEE